ncbi:hypothetical protein P3W45_000676 [Vairimorpha bombi]
MISHKLQDNQQKNDRNFKKKNDTNSFHK